MQTVTGGPWRQRRKSNLIKDLHGITRQAFVIAEYNAGTSIHPASESRPSTTAAILPIDNEQGV